jgi:hypothetical protein
MLLLLFGDGGERNGRVGVSAAGPHLCGDPNGLHQLLWRGPVAQRGLGVTRDAIRALCDVGDGYSNQLFVLAGRASSANTRWLNTSNAAWISGASSRRFAASSLVGAG